MAVLCASPQEDTGKLGSCRSTPFLVASSTFKMSKDSRGLRHFLGRWNEERDTFGAGWGEFGIGCVMFRLPAVGQTSLFNIELDDEEKGSLGDLERGNTVCRMSKRSSFVAWTHFFEDYDEKNTFVGGTGADWGCQVEALIALWLSRFLPPDSPEDTVLSRYFPLAIKITKGTVFPLASLVFGHLYS